MPREKIKFKVVIPMYNVSEWIEKTVGSVMGQKYKNFEAIVIDDISTDNSFELVQEMTKNDDRFTVIKNTEKKFALRNIYEGIQALDPESNDVIVTLDGDDWLATPLVLSKLAQFYSKNDCWLTYGSYMEYPSGLRGSFSKQIPDHVVKASSYRTHEWCSSHLRTFKYGLWSKISKEDLLDEDGNFYKMTWDLAFMLPMLEMAAERAMHIPDVLYVYNVCNPINDHKVDNSYQLKLEKEIRNKNQYSRIEDETKISLKKLFIQRIIMITANLKGGLGNLMFQIATTFALASGHKDKIAFSKNNAGNIHWSSLEKYSDTIFHKIQFKDEILSAPVYSEQNFHFEEITKKRILK